MSMRQFEKWLRENGATGKDGKYYVPCRARKSAEDNDDSLSVIISSARRDRHGDILEPEGADASAFMENPVVLWAHRHDQLPIGRVGDIKIEKGAVTAEVRFDSRPFAREVRRLYREGFLAGWSVGFMPKKWKVIRDDDGVFDGYHISEWELVELSAVPVPANPEALTRELARGGIQSPAMAKSLNEMLAGADESNQPEEAGETTQSPIAQDEYATDKNKSNNHQPEKYPPEQSLDKLAETLIPMLADSIRKWAQRAVESEINRMRGRLD